MNPTERIPVMPQICYDLPLTIESIENETDVLDGYKRCAEKPELSYEYVIQISKSTGCDGLRLFVTVDPMKVIREGNKLVVISKANDKRCGTLDTFGGGHFVPDKKTPPIETLEDAKKRLGEMRDAFTDEKIELLKIYRSKVDDLFVASSPGGITMNIYNDLRGREQAMLDFFERPDFVSAVMDMQAETMIQRAEKLLEVDIDALYIGDPSASASLISPQHFEQFCLPAYKKFCKHFKNTEILIYLHICGNSKPILEMMADSGADVIEPLDPMGGVEVADAKIRVGDRVALMGGVNTVTLCDGSIEDVRNEAIQKCKEGGPHGYILGAGDMVPANTPQENLQAMIDVAKQSLWK